MTDEEMIRRTWLNRVPSDLKYKLLTEYGFRVRATPPIPVASIAPYSDPEPINAEIDVIEYARGPFNTVVGKWRDVVVLV